MASVWDESEVRGPGGAVAGAGGCRSEGDAAVVAPAGRRRRGGAEDVHGGDRAAHASPRQRDQGSGQGPGTGAGPWEPWAGGARGGVGLAQPWGQRRGR